MSEHEPSEPTSTYTYAVGAGLGILVGGAIGLFIDGDVFLPAAILGAAVGIVAAFLVRAFLR